jgi:hypothetical protein
MRTVAFTVPPPRKQAVAVVDVGQHVERAAALDHAGANVVTCGFRKPCPAASGEVMTTGWPFFEAGAADSGKGRWARSLCGATNWNSGSPTLT